MRGGVCDARLGADQDGRQVTGELAGKRDLKRIAIAGIDDRRRQRRQITDAIDQPLEVRAGRHGPSVAKGKRPVNPFR